MATARITENECRNETCDFGELSPAWKFCPECGRPAESQEYPPLILKTSIAYLALYELDPYEFKLFMYIYFESGAVGISWKRIKQEELEKECKISHPKVLKTLKLLKGENGTGVIAIDAAEAAEETPEERTKRILHWIKADLNAERWTKRQGYGLHPDLQDYERIKEMLKPHRNAKRQRNRSYY